MASIGLRNPYYAKYNYDSGTGKVSYSDGGLLAKAIEFSASLESSDANNLYADDGIAESDSTFAGGELTINTDDLTPEVSRVILGLKSNTVTVGTTEVTELVYDEDAAAPYLGFGVIVPKKVNGVKCYRAVVFPRIQFAVPEEAAKTMEDSIEWTTPELTATILRSEEEGAAWKREATVDTLATAQAYIKTVLNITDTASGAGG